MWEVQSTAVQKLLERSFALNYIVTVGILPKVILKIQNLVVKSAISAHLRTGRLKVNPTNDRKRVMTKVQVL